MAKNEELINRFKSLGLSEQKASETLKNTALTQTLLSILHEVTNPSQIYKTPTNIFIYRSEKWL